MPYLSDDFYAQLKEEMKTPAGTCEFKIQTKELYNDNIKTLRIFELSAGEHVFIIERDENFYLKFHYSSAGTGTRVASIDLKEIKACDKLFIAYTWSVKEIVLYVGPAEEDKENLTISRGCRSNKIIRPVKDGGIIELGDDGLDIMEARMFRNGQYILEPTAIETWNNVVTSINILQTGKSECGYLYEIIQTNQIISALVTGFEVYCKKRCIELEKEGIKPDFSSIFNAVYSTYERDNNALEVLTKKASDKSWTIFEALMHSRENINFQNYKKCKLIYSKAFGIKFSEIGVSNTDIQQIQMIIDHRHRIIHVSPQISIINQSEVPPREPLFSDKRLGEKIIPIFQNFICHLHEATLALNA